MSGYQVVSSELQLLLRGSRLNQQTWFPLKHATLRNVVDDGQKLNKSLVSHRDIFELTEKGKCVSVDIWYVCVLGLGYHRAQYCYLIEMAVNL